MENFTKAYHIRDGYILNGEGKHIPIRMTVISKMDGDQVRYKASFCPPSEKYGVDKDGNEYLLKSPRHKQFNKKDGVKYAQQAPEWAFPLSEVENHTHSDITNAIMSDMAKNHIDEVPTNVKRWLLGENFGSDLHDRYEEKLMFEMMLADVVDMLQSAEE